MELQLNDVLLGLQDKVSGFAKAISLRRPEYNPNQTPPDFQMAKEHGIAKKVYQNMAMKVDSNKDETEVAVCPCCGSKKGGEEISLFCKLSELYHLGCGYSLYFRFIKYCGIVLLIMLAVSGLYNLFSNAAGGDCTPKSSDGTVIGEYCTQGYVGTYSLANKRDNPDAVKTQLILNFVSMVLVMIFFHYIRYQVRRVAIDADDKTVTPSDYTLQLKRVPVTTTDEELKTWLESMGTEKEPVKVYKIVRSYDIREYVVLKRRKEELRDQREEATNPEELRIIEDEIESIRQKIGRYKKGGLQFAEAVYVTFEFAKQADFIRKKFIKSPAKKFLDFIIAPFYSSFDRLNGKTIKLKRAPEPTDILWENIGYNPLEKFKKRLFTNLSAIFLILISFALITLLCWAQIHATTSLADDPYLLKFLSLLGSLLIYVVNTALSMTLTKLADYEKHTTYTGYYTGLAKKLTMAMFVNTAFTTLFAKVALAGEFSDTVGIGNYIRAVNFYNTGGLLENIFYVVVTGALLSPFLVIVDPFYIMKLYNQRKELKKGSESTLTQREAHALFEGNRMDMSYKYSLLLKSMLFAAFYAPALPTVIIVTLVGLVLSYWADKYVLLRRNALPSSLDDDLTQVMIEYLEWTPFMYALGNLMFTLILQTSSDEPPYDNVGLGLVWATLIVSLVNMVAPMDLVNETILYIPNEVTETCPFYNARLSFPADYDVQNPITRKKALKEFVALTKKHQEILNNFTEGSPSKIGGAFLKGLAEDIMKVVDTEPHETEVDLAFLDAYAARVKEKPIEETHGPEDVFNEHQIDYSSFMSKLGEVLMDMGKGNRPKPEGKDDGDERTSLL